MRRKGVVKFFNRKNKFGFIRDSETGAELYVHIKDVKGDIKDGDQVRFVIKQEKRGDTAVDVEHVNL
jgi:CspA family cold shock protein